MYFYMFSTYLFVMIGRPQDYLTFLQPLRPALVLEIISLAFLLTQRGLGLNEVFKLSETKKYLLFYLIMVLGIPFAIYSRKTFDYCFLTYSNNILFFFIFILANDSFEKLRKTTFIIILSVFTYSIICLGEGSLIQGRFRFGTMFDPNDLAYFLISLLPLSLFFIIHNLGKVKRALSLITFGLSILISLLTGSRAGIITFIITFITILFTIKFAIKKKIFLISILIIISMVFHDKIDIDRYLTLFNIKEDYNITSETGRLTLWERSFMIIRENPFLGVGAANFPEAIGRIRQEINLPQARWQAAHNSYILVASELGLIGLIIYLLMILGCLKYFYVLSKGKAKWKYSIEVQTISRLLLTATIATSIAGFFLSQAYSIIFTLLFAYSGALRHLNSKINEGA